MQTDHRTTLRDMIMHLLDSYNLSDWEDDFINSLADKDDDYVFSDRQEEVLHKIYNEKG